MIEKFISSRILQSLPFTPNEGQQTLIEQLGMFIGSSAEHTAFVLRGYAGTGKTSVMAALVRAMNELQQQVVLLAPTGRAAKVLAHYAGFPAYTIHKYIYRQQQLGIERFSLSENKHQRALFIVDEASMLSSLNDNPTFGSGNLLSDLIQYVYSSPSCRLLLVGDTAQLPPVGSSQSPALDTNYMQGFGLTVTAATLTQVARQALDSGILSNATRLRQCILSGETFDYTFTDDVIALSPADFQETLEQSYREVGVAETLVLTRTNRRTNLYNQGIRARILYREDELGNGDRLMVSKNNYFFTEPYPDLPFLANGDMFEVKRLRHAREMYGFRFVDASLHALDYDWDIDVVLWLDTLFTDSPEQNYDMQKTLFARVAEDYPEYAHNRRKLTEAIFQSPYYNALQARFAYAVTCHKAQGGQWHRVFIDPGNRPETESNTDFYRWLYTALTRAGEKVYILKVGSIN